jgi:hypothetical protein
MNCYFTYIFLHTRSILLCLSSHTQNLRATAYDTADGRTKAITADTWEAAASEVESLKEFILYMYQC